MRSDPESRLPYPAPTDDLFDGIEHLPVSVSIMAERFEKNPAAQRRAAYSVRAGKQERISPMAPVPAANDSLMPAATERWKLFFGNLPLDADDVSDPVDKRIGWRGDAGGPGPEGKMGELKVGMGIDQRRQQYGIPEIDRWHAGGARQQIGLAANGGDASIDDEESAILDRRRNDRQQISGEVEFGFFHGFTGFTASGCVKSSYALALHCCRWLRTAHLAEKAERQFPAVARFRIAPPALRSGYRRSSMDWPEPRAVP